MRGRTWSAAAIVLALVCASGVAWSHSNGESGHSGKQGLTCNDCHSGGPTPNVSFDGPLAIEAGTTVTYTFHVKTTQPLAGMNVAATTGIQLHDDDGGTTYFSASEELVHPRPLATGAGDAGDAGDAVFTFSLDAPAYAGSIQLWGAGNAVNGDKDTTGDQADTTKITITVDGPLPPQPEAGPPPPPPPPPTATSTATAPPPPSSPDAGATPPNADDTSSGCAVGASALDAPSGAAAFVVLFFARAFSRRRRRTSRPS